MGVKHINKSFELQLPSSARFVLTALARYADNTTDSCFPGIEKLTQMTGYCPKTVLRCIRLLTRLGIIDTKKRSNTSNLYTLYLTGSIKAWDKYLKSKADVIKDMNRENQSASITPSTIYKYSYNSKFEKVEKEKEGLVTGDKSPVVKQTINLNAILEENINDIPPGRRISPLQRCWEQSVIKYHKGIKVVFTPDDKWAVDDMINNHETQLPLLEIIEYSVVNWHKISAILKKNCQENYYAKHFPKAPSFYFMYKCLEVVEAMFIQSKSESEC